VFIHTWIKAIPDPHTSVLKVLRQWLETHRVEAKDWTTLVQIQNFASGIREPATIAQNAERLIAELIDPQVRLLKCPHESAVVIVILGLLASQA
jgi:hypothetical protein